MTRGGGAALRQTLGVAAIALGLGLAASYAFDRHSHVCDRCGHRWNHFGAFNGANAEAHTCSKCGALQWWKHPAPSRELRAAHDHATMIPHAAATGDRPRGAYR